MRLDATDREILRRLRADGRISVATIAKEVGLSAPAVHDRLRKLERGGAIAGYTAVLDPETLGRPQVAFVLVSLLEGGDFADERPIVKAISEEPDVLELHHVAGEDCYLIKSRTATTQELERLLVRIRAIPGVARTRTTVVLSTELERPGIEVPAEPASLRAVEPTA